MHPLTTSERLLEQLGDPGLALLDLRWRPTGPPARRRR
jgi:hypothetical protein